VPDEFDALASALEMGLPIAEYPFAALADGLGLSEDSAIAAAREMRRSGLIRRFGAFFDFHRLGMRGYLFGASVPESAKERLISLLRVSRNVTHIYGREHDISLWFTALVRDDAEAMGVCRVLRDMGCGFVALGMSRMIKLRPSFAGSCLMAPAQNVVFAARDFKKTDEREMPAVRALQRVCEISRRPFAAAAHSAGMGEGELLGRAKNLLERGILRRIGASLDHNRAGWTANSLVAFETSGSDDEAAMEAEKVVSVLPWASHCYLRRIFDYELAGKWIYNLYIMIHATSWDELGRREDFIRDKFPYRNFISLRTAAEYKKTSFVI
jgi:DNA-binding Lrp family transcriptional regulator